MSIDINNNDNRYRRGQRAKLHMYGEFPSDYMELPCIIGHEKPIKIVCEGDWELSRDVNCDDPYTFTARKNLTNSQKQQLIDLINGVRV